jgi:hypothetical protein
MEEKEKIASVSALNIFKFLAIIGVIAAAFNFGHAVFAASLYFSPAAGSYAVGDVFSVGVTASSPDQQMNAASGEVSFPPDKLEVVSLSKSSSILDLWVKDPSYSNSLGIINFEGISLDASNGKGGNILKISFRVKNTGTASLIFSSGSVLANDGKGTSILSGLGQAAYSLVAAGAEPEPAAVAAPAVNTVVPLSPVITSPAFTASIPQYNNNNPELTWLVGSDITADKISYDQIPNSHPEKVSIPPLAEMKLNNLTDGIWYLHVQLRNKNGWGDVAHFGFNVDTRPPENFSLTFANGNQTDNSQPKIFLSAVNASSSVKSYLINIDNGEDIFIPAAATGTTAYVLPWQKLGDHQIAAKAFDGAGNYATTSAQFTINAILPPVFKEYPANLSVDEILAVKGTVSVGDNLIIWLQRNSDNPQSFQVESDSNGSFTFVDDEKLKSGTYHLWGEAINASGAASNPSPKLTISVRSPFLKLDYFSIIAISIVVIILLVMLPWYIYMYKKYELLKEDANQPAKSVKKRPKKRK